MKARSCYVAFARQLVIDDFQFVGRMRHVPPLELPVELAPFVLGGGCWPVDLEHADVDSDADDETRMLEMGYGFTEQPWVCNTNSQAQQPLRWYRLNRSGS